MKDDEIKIYECPYTHTRNVEPIITVQQYGKYYAVVCGVCGAAGPMATKPEKAVKRWNRRSIILVPEDKYNEAVATVEWEDKDGVTKAD